MLPILRILQISCLLDQYLAYSIFSLIFIYVVMATHFYISMPAVLIILKDLLLLLHNIVAVKMQFAAFVKNKNHSPCMIESKQFIILVFSCLSNQFINIVFFTK